MINIDNYKLEKTQIERLNDTFLKRGVQYSVYPYDSYTLNGLLVQFFRALNECIDSVNKYTEMLYAFMEWIENEGIQIAVNKKIQELIDQGYFNNVINQEIFGRLNDTVLELQKRVLNVVEKDAVIDYGLVSNEDNTQKFKDMILGLPNNVRLNIPKGEYIVKITDRNVVKCSNGYTLVFNENLKNATIGGEGTIVVDTSECTLKNWLIYFNSSEFIRLDKLKIRGDFESVEGQVVRDSFPNGIVFEKSNKIIVKDCYMSKMFAVLSTTGNGASPSTTIDVAKDIIIQDNIFENYGQISTYGGGASNYIFTGNIMINPLQTGIKISRNPLIAEVTKTNSKQFIISDNNVTWTDDFKFGVPSWNTSTTYSPCGIMVEAKSDVINIEGNTIDMSAITQDLSNPIQTIASIIVYKGGNSIDYQINKLLISGNNCNTYKLQSDISISPYAISTTVLDNVVKNGISLATYGQTKQEGAVLVKGNTIEKGNGYIPIRCNIDTVIIEDNTFVGTVNAIIETSESNLTNLKIISNDMVNGKITTIGNVTVKDFFVSDNKSVDTLNITSHSEGVHVTNNHTKEHKTHYTISVDANTNVFFDGNYGEVSSILNLTNGNLYLGVNPVKTQASILYTLPNVTVMSGQLIGGGAPQFKAFRGVTYIDSASTNEVLYIQVDAIGTNWKKIQYN